MLYPHYLYLRDQLRPDVSVYYNVDDYALYWPAAGGPDPRAGAGGGAVGRRDDLRLAAAGRGAAGRRCRKRPTRIHHVPHGAPTPFLAAQPLVRPAAPPADIAHLPRPLLGYIGSLEDRVDWELMDRLSRRRFPTPRSSWWAGPGRRSPKPWWEACGRFLARPNVHALGWRPQEALAALLPGVRRLADPLSLDHPFNRACSPTKIMDAMGSGRPIVATAIPECRLHAERFHVAENADEFLAAVRRILDQQFRRRPRGVRHAYALANTCHGIGERILDLIDGRIGGDAAIARVDGRSLNPPASTRTAGTDRWQLAPPGGRVVRKSIR